MVHNKYVKSYAKLRKQILEAPHAFALLGVHRQTDIRELTLARRELMKQVHPDVNSSPDAHKLSALVNAAHTALESDMDGYVRSLMKKSCEQCSGKGVLKKQKGFVGQVLSVCAACHGAGVV